MPQNILHIVDRIKKIKHLVTDGEVAEVLRMTKGALSAHKKRGSIPYEALSIFCEQERVSFDWLLTGEGEMYKIEGDEKKNKEVEGEGFTVSLKGPEEMIYVGKLLKVLRGKNYQNIIAIKANIEAFYSTAGIDILSISPEVKEEEELPPIKKKKVV